MFDIVISNIKIASVPRVSDALSVPTCKVKEQTNLVIIISANDTVNITQIVPVHGNNVIVIFIVTSCHLASSLTCNANAKLRQLLTCAVMNRASLTRGILAILILLMTISNKAWTAFLNI